MKKLQSDWLTQGWIDAEYQKYVVMAYLQAVQRNFLDEKLCPDLPDLRTHYENSLSFRQRKGTLNDAFPKRAVRIDPARQRIEYKSEVPDDGYLSEIDAIMEFAVPRFGQLLQEGQQLWEDIATSLTIEPVGLMPLRPDEGYLLLHRTTQAETHIYQFSLTLFDEKQPGGRTVHLHFVETKRKSIGTTFENMKMELVRRNRHLPNPATFMLESKRNYPVQETLLPIARQLIVKAATA